MLKYLFVVLKISNFKESLRSFLRLLISRQQTKIAFYLTRCTPISKKPSTWQFGIFDINSGFNVEDTHLKDNQRIERLFAILTIAFLWAYLVGVFKDQNIRPIRTLNNGRRAFSFFKYGLDAISSILLNLDRQTDIDFFKILSCT